MTTPSFWHVTFTPPVDRTATHHRITHYMTIASTENEAIANVIREPGLHPDNNGVGTWTAEPRETRAIQTAVFSRSLTAAERNDGVPSDY